MGSTPEDTPCRKTVTCIWKRFRYFTIYWLLKTTQKNKVTQNHLKQISVQNISLLHLWQPSEYLFLIQKWWELVRITITLLWDWTWVRHVQIMGLIREIRFRIKYGWVWVVVAGGDHAVYIQENVLIEEWVAILTALLWAVALCSKWSRYVMRLKTALEKVKSETNYLTKSYLLVWSDNAWPLISIYLASSSHSLTFEK